MSASLPVFVPVFIFIELIFIVLFTVLLIAELMIMFRQIKLGPQPAELDAAADAENKLETKN